MNFLIKSIFFIIYFFTYFTTTLLYAFEIENRLPKSIWDIEINFKNIPTYNKAFNGYGEKGPLHELILWHFDWRENVEGELKREEQKIEIKMTYAFAEKWLIRGYIPLINKNQISTLKFESGNSNQKKIINNLKSENFNGLGDISFQISNDMSFGTTWNNRGGLIFKIPTGNTGNRRGTLPNAIGEGHSSIGGFIHFNWFPLISGLRSGFKIQGTNELIGEKRETLDGIESYYAAGNTADIYYNWSFERKNLFLGTELHYYQQSESHFPTGESNDAYLKEIKFELGYGNLSDLENQSLKLPWQLRFGYVHPISGQNIPFAKRFEINSNIFF